MPGVPRLSRGFLRYLSRYVDLVGGDFREAVHKVKYNLEYVEAVLECDEWYLKGFNHAPPGCSGADERIAILSPVVLPASARAVDILVPDHCPGYSVFFAGLRHEPDCCGGRIFSPVLVMACRHFEHGDTHEELMDLSFIVSLAGREAFYPGVQVLSEVYAVNPVSEDLMVVIEPGDCTEENCYTRRPGKALRLFSRVVREQLRDASYLIPPALAV